MNDAPTLFQKDFIADQPSNFLENLNPAQRQAVDQIYGTVLVLAGPGTGKTHMLTARIANILQQTDSHANNILCLTFTENGATQMRRRLASWIGPDAYKVRISTFHGFCENVMQQSPESFQNVKGSRELADDLEKALVFKKVIESKKWKHFRPFGDNLYWHGAFRSTISHLKRENISAEKLREMIEPEKQRLLEDPKNYYQRDSKWGKKGDLKITAKDKIEKKGEQMFEFCDLWEAYESEMQAQDLYDFDDQILWVVQKLSKEEGLRADLQEQFQFLLVDEYQDTNSAQNQILWHLCDGVDDPNLFAVGDDDQCVYRFQGASLANITAFEQHFPKTNIIALKENYRSGQKILDAAYGSVAQNLERKIPDKSLVASGDNKNIQATLHKAVLLSRFGEITFLADQIKKTIEAGTKPSEITILCRENKEVREIAQLLQKFKIPVSAQVFENVFEDPHVMNLIQMLQIFANPTLDHEFLHLLHAKFWDVEDKILFDLSIAARKTPIAKLLQEHPDFKNIINLFITGKREHAQSSPVKIAESLFHDSGLFVFLAREENLTKTADLLRIQKFLDWIKLQESKGTKTLPALLEKIQAHQELNLSLRADPLPTDKNAVGIMTAHRSKGSEFDVVFIPGLLDRVWGNRRSRAGIPLPELFHSLQDDNEEERRLFFVALTRARKQIFLSHSEKDFSGRDRLMSEFWHEIPDDTCEIIASEKSEEHAQNLLPIFFSTQAPAFTGEEEEMLKNLAAKHVWSASSLQDFLDCPRKFLYTRLLRFPLPPNKHMSLGTALHSALEDLLKQFQQQQKLPSLEQLLASFREHISRQWLSGAEREECVLHGTELLKNYHEKCAQTLSSDVLLEFNFSSHHVKINNIPVTGKVDKIELGPDKKAILVDYKTGRPKSIKKDDRYWRQLVFYDLMARHAKNLDFQIEKCVLEFLTPDAKGNLMRKEVAITEEDRAQVIQELKDCHEQLQNLNFPILDNLEQDSEMDYWQKLGI